MDELWTSSLRTFAAPVTNAVVGGKTYRCVDGVLWTSDNGHAKGDAGCRIDALAAAAAATGHSVPAWAPAECKRPEPCVRDADGDLLCYNSDATTRMPSAVLHANLRCN